MGASNFGQTEVGKYKDANEAYRQAQEEATWESGHDPYNGTISTCTSLSKARNAPRYGTKAFDKFEDERTENMDKRDCEFVEITGAALKKLKGNRFKKGAKGIKAFYFFGWAAE